MRPIGVLTRPPTCPTWYGPAEGPWSRLRDRGDGTRHPADANAADGGPVPGGRRRPLSGSDARCAPVSSCGASDSSPPCGVRALDQVGDGRVGLYAGFCPRAPRGIPVGGHPSRPAVAGRLERPTRRHRAGSPRSPAQDGGEPSSLLALLRVGFTEPHRSPGVRWSLTPPFHPYQCEHWRSVLCGTVPRVTPGRC